jgi:hemerythrin-like domain-containing protein
MTTGTLATALEREHREIDAGIEAFLASLADGQPRPEPLVRAMQALRRHIYLEEQFVFPPLREAGMVAPIFEMLREHGEIWDTMAATDREIARDGDGAAMSEVCRGLLEQLERHNAKEEPIIYPQADAVLTGDAGTELREHLAAGRLPEGWVCARAGA